MFADKTRGAGLRAGARSSKRAERELLIAGIFRPNSINASAGARIPVALYIPCKREIRLQKIILRRKSQ